MPKHIAIGISFRPHDQHANTQYDSRIKMMTIWFTNKDRRQIFPRDINFEIFRRGQFLVVRYFPSSFVSRKEQLIASFRVKLALIFYYHTDFTFLQHLFIFTRLAMHRNNHKKKKKKHNVTGFSITYVTHTSIFARRGEGKRKGRNP